ncbi:MAG TPA: DNRLRE domain-containing protein, partial [Candidatus Poseidoniaceae archaeon]
MPYASEKRRALTAIFIVFLFIFSEILVAENDVQHELNDRQTAAYSLYQYSSNAETFISLQDPDDNFNSANNNLIGVDSLLGTETRGLYRFINNLTSASDSIISAELTLTCEVATEALPGTPPVLYPATIIANFAPLEVTWNEIADSINWQSPGIEGTSDRTVWDTPSTATQLSSTIHEYSLNVTKLAQTSLDLGRNKFDFVISAIGGE